MPDLPEVETIKTAIARALGHCNINAIKVNNNKFRETIPADLAEKFKGAKINGYRRIAKYIIIDCDNGLSLIWHLGMSGRVKITDELPNPPDKHDHVVISTDKSYVIFHDPRRFGLMTYCLTAELNRILSAMILTPVIYIKNCKRKKYRLKLLCWIRKLSSESATFMPRKHFTAREFCPPGRPT